MTYSDDSIAAIEDKIRELEGIARLLLAARLVDDGHALTWKGAIKQIREDPEAVMALYE